MNKRVVLSILAVFAAWFIMDWIIHGKILMQLYVDSAELWRPMEEMKSGLGLGVTLISAVGFVLIYAFLAKARNIGTGIQYGFIFGISAGVSMGFGSYCWMPLPLDLAWGWTLGTIAEALVAGILVGTILKDAEA